MPVMEVYNWDVKSKAGLFNKAAPRPPSLVAIDQALIAYHRRTGTIAALQLVIDNFLAIIPCPTTGPRDATAAVRELKGQADQTAGLTLLTEIPEAANACTQAAAGLVLSNATAKSVDVKGHVTQHTMGADPAWDVFWNLSLTSPDAFTKPSGMLGIMTVTVPIVEQGLGAGHIAITQGTKDLWSKHITTMWNSVIFMVRNSRMLEVRFALDWRPAGTPNVFNINAAPTPPVATVGWQTRRAQDLADLQAGIGDRQIGGVVGTPHLSQWGEGDVCAVSHEFGHMLGLPDEYETTTYMGVAVPGLIYDQTAFTTNSLMNNTGEKGLLHKRHYHMIRRSLELWKNLPANSTTTTIKGTV